MKQETYNILIICTLIVLAILIFGHGTNHTRLNYLEDYSLILDTSFSYKWVCDPSPHHYYWYDCDDDGKEDSGSIGWLGESYSGQYSDGKEYTCVFKELKYNNDCSNKKLVKFKK